jgi:hypothetical protein
MRVKTGELHSAVEACIGELLHDGKQIGVRSLRELMAKKYGLVIKKHADMFAEIGWQKWARSYVKKARVQGLLSSEDIQAELGFGRKLPDFIPVPSSEDDLLGGRDWKQISTCDGMDLSLSIGHLDMQLKNDRKRRNDIRQLRDWLEDIAAKSGNPGITVTEAIRWTHKKSK